MFMETKKPTKKTPAKTPKKSKADVSAKKTTEQNPRSTKSKTERKVNCQLPGAELLAEGKSVVEVMQTLDQQKESSLSVKEELFCQEYVSCNVAVRAALRVWPELSYDYASTKSERLMKKDEIKQRISQITEEHKERYGLTESKILKRLAALATFDRRTLHRPDGTIKPIHELTEEEAAAITEIESVELFEGRGEDRQAIGVVRKVKFADPKGSLELAGKHLKLFTEKHEHSGPGGGAIPVEMNHIQRAARISHLLKTAMERAKDGIKPE